MVVGGGGGPSADAAHIEHVEFTCKEIVPCLSFAWMNNASHEITSNSVGRTKQNRFV